jgi:hypothetical protein
MERIRSVSGTYIIALLGAVLAALVGADIFYVLNRKGIRALQESFTKFVEAQTDFIKKQQEFLRKQDDLCQQSCHLVKAAVGRDQSYRLESLSPGMKEQ